MTILMLVFAAGVLGAQDIDELMKTAHAGYLKGDYASARTVLEQAWALAEQSPPEEPKRYDVLKELSAALSAAGDFDGAQNYAEMALNWRESVMGPDDPKLADDLIELATLCQRRKDLPRALAILESAQSIHIRAGGFDSAAVADDFSRMALIYVADGKFQLAANVSQRAIEIREKLLGAQNPATLTDLDRMAAAWIASREYPKAEEAFRRALVIRERLVGRVHADLIPTVEGLAYAQFGQKKYDEAEPGYKRLLSLWAISTGQPDHPMIALTLDKIAVFYRQQKRWEEGNAAAEKGNALRALFLANGLSQDASARQAHGDKKEAVRLFTQALGALDESRPEHAEMMQQLRTNLRDLATNEHE
jgi:tetratricopeptide (TPR) repeat protein